MPAAAEAMRRQLRDVAAFELDRACARAQQSGERVDQRRLAGAVGADHAQQLALAHAERHPP
jgi:hypothetical protein